MKEILKDRNDEHALLQDISREQFIFIKMLIHTDAGLVGSLFSQTFNIDGKDVLFWGRFLRWKRAAHSACVCYWQDGFPEHTGEDHTVNVYTIVTDMLGGDCQFQEH